MNRIEQRILTDELVKELANEIGIDAIGLTKAERFGDMQELLAEYRSKGYETGFEHPVIEERIDPTLLVPDAKSIIAIAIAYKRPETDRTVMPRDRLRGMISKYSWGYDYHHVLRDKMNQLIKRLEEWNQAPFQYHLSVDTGPLVDRAVAERAGIGWLGKNCSIITETHGSWVFLGQIVTDLPMNSGSKVLLSQCGDCDLCIT